MPNSDEVTDEIRIALETINDAWRSESPAAVRLALTACFHPEMVIKDAKLKTVATGREACVQSYVDFVERAEVSDFHQAEPDIHLFPDLAIASYDWRIAYLLDGKRHDERGYDIFVFVRAEEKWLAVWRAALTG
jgi:ketosteroid isomerase-like protein